jgi:hypothetical protein
MSHACEVHHRVCKRAQLAHARLKSIHERENSPPNAAYFACRGGRSSRMQSLEVPNGTHVISATTPISDRFVMFLKPFVR